MLSSIRSRRRFILASVKFLSRALTALNLEPSMATLATLSKSSSRHSATKVRQTSRNGLAVVLAEIRNGLEVRRQLAGQPDQLDITLAFTLKPSARRNAIEIAINIYLEQCRRMVAGPPFFQRLNPTKAKLIKIKTFNERVNRTNGIVLGHVVVKHGREKCALASVNPFHKA